MNLKYKIIEVYPEQHSIVVRFYTDVITEQMLATDVLDGVIRRGRTDYNIDLPIPAPTGDALAKFISTKAPWEWFAAQEAVLNPAIDTSLSDITGLVGQELTPSAPPVQPVVVTTNASLDTANPQSTLPVTTL
jgi:hypothetical protein